MKKILGFLKPMMMTLIIAIILTLLSQGVVLLLPYLMSMIVNNGITNPDMGDAEKLDYIKKFGSIMVVSGFAGFGLSVLNSYYTSKLSANFGKVLRREVFFKVESLSQCDIDKIGTDSLITRCTNDIKQIQDFILIGIRMILAAPIMLIGGTVMAFIMNAKLAMYVFAVVPVLALIVFVLMKVVMPLFKKRQRMTDKLNQLIREKLSGIRVIRAFNKTEYEDAKFDKSNAELADLALKIARLFSVLIPFSIILAFSGVCALIWVAAKNVDALPVTDTVAIQNTIGDLQAFVVYMVLIVAALSMAAGMFVIVPRANISAKRIVEVLELETDIVQPEASAQTTEKGTVEFRTVSFCYPGSAEPVVQDISFVANPGETTAIIGGTGSGKSSVLGLIPRFYDATSGSVLVDGADVKELDGEELCARLGYIPQTASLFSGTIRDNVRFGKPDATDEEVWKALEIAQAADFVRLLPEGLDASVSQNATNLSGGQKQRIAIARAIIRKAEIYLFDDSFSALDFRTDTALRIAIAKELTDSAIIIVAQRVGTILHAEKIVVLDEGRIAGTGTHSYLLENCPVYREIVESQLSEQDLKERGNM